MRSGVNITSTAFCFFRSLRLIKAHVFFAKSREHDCMFSAMKERGLVRLVFDGTFIGESFTIFRLV